MWFPCGSAGVRAAHDASQPTCKRNRPFWWQMEEVLQGVTAPPPGSGGQAKKCVGGAPSVRLTIAVKALALA